VKLTNECDSLKVDATLYGKLGNRIYLTHNRPDISFAINVVSHFMKEPKESHLKATKKFVCSIKGTY
jgi:hypothetical protein